MSDKMNKLKEAAGENVLDKDQLDLIAVGNVAQTEELWNFYMNHGAEGFLKKYKRNHAKGVLEALKKEGIDWGGDNNLVSIANATSKEGENVYRLKAGETSMTHGDLIGTLRTMYEDGNGFFGTVK